MDMDIEALTAWFTQHKRSLPWRERPTPYRVWVSEVMLQQTQAAVVEPYFLRWMERFPTLRSLASASFEEVLKAWEGLGYYRRVRSLHRGAQSLVASGYDELPPSEELLARLPGVGAYTRGALLSFAFHKRAVALDGNVVRVMSRYQALEAEVDRPKVQKELAAAVEARRPEREPWVAMEALIELGALVCQKQPRCAACPVRAGCLGYQQGAVERLPLKRKRAATSLLERRVAIVTCAGEVLLRRESGNRVMADLFEFPYTEGEIEAFVCEELGLEALLKGALPPLQHAFTRYRVSLYPTLWEARRRLEVPGLLWLPISSLGDLPFPSGHRTLAHLLIAIPT
jgi:A/G-specific adenine glycosylase